MSQPAVDVDASSYPRCGRRRLLSVARTVAFGASAFALGGICEFLHTGAGSGSGGGVSAPSTLRRDGTTVGDRDGCRSSDDCEQRLGRTDGGGGEEENRSRKRVVRLAGDDCGSIVVPDGSSRGRGHRRSRPVEVYHNASYVNGFLPDPSSPTGLRRDNAQPRDMWSDATSGCVPMQEWQTMSYPSCNDLHGFDMPGGSVKMAWSLHGTTDSPGGMRYMTRGGARMVWRFVDDAGTVVILKTLRMVLPFDESHEEHQRLDAMAMERLTSSPHVIDIHGYCGQSSVSEFADGADLSRTDKKRWTPSDFLNAALGIANAVSDLQSIDDGEDENGTNATLIHRDISPSNFLVSGGKPKLNDFNMAKFVRWNVERHERCGFPCTGCGGKGRTPHNRAPEECQTNGTHLEKVDTYGIGVALFNLLTSSGMYNCERDGRCYRNKRDDGSLRLDDDEVRDLILRGKGPTLPGKIERSDNPAVVAIRTAMRDALTADPDERPSAREIARQLERAIFDIEKGWNAN